MHPTPMHNDTNEDDDEVQVDSDDDEPKESDDALWEDIMQVARQYLEDNTEHVEDVQVNNEYVKHIDPHPDESEDDDWVNLTRVKHISSEMLTSPTTIDDLKVRDILESKVNLL